MNFKNTRQLLLVLDKNVLRADAATDAKARVDAAGLGILVIDTTFKEIVRAGNWPKQFEYDFMDWTDRRDRMSVSWGVGDILKGERKIARAAPIVHDKMTKKHRRLLTAMANGNQADLVAARPRVQTEAARMRSENRELDAPGRLAMMRTMLNVWWKWGDQHMREIIKKELNDPAAGPLINLAHIALTTKDMRECLQESLILTDCDPSVAKVLLEAPTFTNFLHSTYEAYSLLLWAQDRRLDGNDNAEKLLNQMLDLDYVTYALCCTGLATNDVIIGRLEAGMRIASEMLWP